VPISMQARALLLQKDGEETNSMHHLFCSVRSRGVPYDRFRRLRMASRSSDLLLGVHVTRGWLSDLGCLQTATLGLGALRFQTLKPLFL
jgi:hypothetical protein